MALVIQPAPADPLVALFDAPKQVETASAGAGPGEIFAALLAGLPGHPPTEGAANGPMPPPGPPIEGEAKPAEPGAEVPAVMAAMQLLAQLGALPGPDFGGQNTAEASLAAASPPNQALRAPASELPAIAAPAAEGPGAAAAPSPEAGAPPSPATGPVAAPAPLAATPAEQPPTASLLAAAVVATVEAAAHTVVKQGRAQPESPRPVDGASPALPPPSEGSPMSIVSVDRPAGNAGQSGQSDGHADPSADANGNANGEKGGARPGPALQGVAAAGAASSASQLRPADPTALDLAQAAPAPAPLPEAVEHVGRTIIQKVEQGGGEARLTLRPEALGEVVLHIRTDGDRVRVEIHAERAEAANLLRDHTQDLAQLLGQRGLNLTNVHVGLGGQGASNQGDGLPAWAQPRQQTATGFASLLGIDDPGAADRSNRLRSAYNPDGAMSYRV